MFSNGQPVKASDFKCTVERMIKVNWGGKASSPTTSSGRPTSTRARRTTSRASRPTTPRGKITIQLDKPYGAFTNVLAFPSLGLVPCGTPDAHDLTTDMPPGVGPYMITDVVPNKSFSVVKNPKFAALEHPGHPDGSPRPDQRDDRSRTPRPRPSRCSTTRRTTSTPATRCRRRSCRRSSRRRATASSR